MERLIDGLSITSVLNMLLQQVCYGVNVQMNYSPFLWSVEVGEKFLCIKSSLVFNTRNKVE